MVKDRPITKEMVEANRFNLKPARLKLARLLRRRGRRDKFKTHNTARLTVKVK